MISLFSVYDLLISTLPWAPCSSGCLLIWQAQAPDARLWKICICYIWFLSRFDKPLCWQLQKCLWADHSVKTSNWLKQLMTIIWVDTGQKGKNGWFCPYTDNVLDKWFVAFHLQSTPLPRTVQIVHPHPTKLYMLHTTNIFPSSERTFQAIWITAHLSNSDPISILDLEKNKSLNPSPCISDGKINK